MTPQPDTEQTVASWTEPTELKHDLRHVNISYVIAGGIVIFIALVAAGYFEHDFTFYLGSVAAILGAITIVVRRKKPTPPLPIKITTKRLSVGSKDYELATIAGFWIENDPTMLIINVEPAKAALFPISFRYQNHNLDEARGIMLSVMDEVEPRQPTLSDRVSQYIRF